MLSRVIVYILILDYKPLHLHLFDILSAAVFSKLNISVNKRPVKMIFGSYHL